ncbi:hypothetical protein G3I45_25325, partial [Streptomyces sp. SID339]|nr:hypothetical protein [Streptomyces sp. SID339]
TAPRDWGFVLASRTRPVLRRAAGSAVVRAGEPAAELTRQRGLAPSTLMHPRYAN